ncbi:hypothetical protein GUY61_37675 [Streptomyces sp. GC420]|nr:hypothetical protein [Streptomyces sp. GC420]
MGHPGSGSGGGGGAHGAPPRAGGRRKGRAGRPGSGKGGGRHRRGGSQPATTARQDPAQPALPAAPPPPPHPPSAAPPTTGPARAPEPAPPPAPEARDPAGGTTVRERRRAARQRRRGGRLARRKHRAAVEAAERARATVPSTAPGEAFDTLYDKHAAALARQAYLLTGRRGLAREAVERAFQSAWHRWPEVAVDPEPGGWVRARAYGYALSPWHRARPAHRHPDRADASQEDQELLDTLLGLPPSYRSTLLLHDTVGLGLPETAAETEATTSAAANRLAHAREALIDRYPEFGRDPELMRGRISALAPRTTQLPAARVIRLQAEQEAGLWTRATIAVAVLLLGFTAFTAITAPSGYEPPRAPGRPVGIVPGPRPDQLTEDQMRLRDKLRSEPANGPERLSPLGR